MAPPEPPRLRPPSPDGLRGVDAEGSGAFMAPREGGRWHRGLDILARAGEEIRAPIKGRFARCGVCYPDDDSYHYVDIAAADDIEVKVFYVEPARALSPGARIRAGQVIGRAQAISARYGGRVPNHVHLEVWVRGAPVDPAPLIAWRRA
jgi:murein DD-endopeptidase MepM/ murein hydrolase activator NlpD